MNKEVMLNSKVDLEIIPTAPFAFEGTVHKASHFPTPDNYYEQAYWQSLRFRGRLYGIKLTDVGTVDQPKISLSVYYDTTYRDQIDANAIVNEIAYRFDLRSNLIAFTTNFNSDPILAPIIDRWQGMRIST